MTYWFPAGFARLLVSVLFMCAAVGLGGCAGSNSARSDIPESCRSDNYDTQDAEAKSARERPNERPPELIGGMKSLYEAIDYPPKAREVGAEGVSWIQFFISPEGETTKARVCQTAGNSILDREAWEAVQQLEWRPGMRGDEPVEVHMTLPVNFSLDR